MNQPPSSTHLICVGDSLTAAIPTPELEKWPTSLALALKQEWPCRYSVFNRGFNGATSAAGFDRIESEVSYLLPATVLVEFGINDAMIRPSRKTPQIGLQEFKNNLREIHRYLSERGSRVIFIAAHSPDPDRRENLPPSQMYIPGNQKTYAENYQPYHQAILSLGSELKIPVIDIPLELERSGLKTSDIVMDDGLHLTSRGNAVYAEIIAGSLKRILVESDAVPRTPFGSMSPLT